MATKDRCPTCSSQNKSDIRHISIKGSPWTPCTDPWHEGRSAPQPVTTLTIEIEQEVDGRWLAEISQMPGALAYGTTKIEASVGVLTIALEDERVIAEPEGHEGRSSSPAAKTFYIAQWFDKEDKIFRMAGLYDSEEAAWARVEEVGAGFIHEARLNEAIKFMHESGSSEGAPLPAPSPEALEDYGAGPNWPMLSKELDRLPEHERNNFIADVISQIDDTQFFRIFKRNATIYAKSYPVSGRVSPTPGKVENTAPEVITANQERGISPESSSPVEPEILRQWRDPRNHFEELWHKEILAYIDGLKGKPAASHEDLVIEIARELYDRFVMGGWQPQDAYPQIRGWLAQVGDSGAHKEK